MAEAIKKAKTPSKAKKVVAEKAVTEKPAAKKAVTEKPAPKKAVAKKDAVVKSVSQEEVAALAHHYWAERGYRHGDHIQDWLRAEQELRGKVS